MAGLTGRQRELLDALAVKHRLVAFAEPAGPVLDSLPQEPASPLTMREVEVLQLIACGLTNVEVAAALVISTETVKSHVRHLLAKLPARSRAHAVAVGYTQSILDPLE